MRMRRDDPSRVSFAGFTSVRLLSLFIVCAGAMFFVGTGCNPGGGGNGSDVAGGGDAGADGGRCSSACESPGTQFCDDESTAVQCVEEGGCLVERTIDCPSFKRCEGGTCVSKDSDCSNRCFGGEDPRCNGEGAVVRCDDHDGDGCFEWGDPSACEGEETCTNGSCRIVDCEGSCSEGETRCEEELVQVCEKQPNGCLEFSAGKPCPEGEVCSGGSCGPADSCSDECNSAVCGSDGGIRPCNDVDGDGCAELAEAEPCGDGESCEAGVCTSASECSDQCPDGESICVGSKIAECADHDDDGCVEFESPRSCPSGGRCESGDGTAQCQSSGSGGSVVINEFLYDPLGEEVRGSGSDASSPTFVELAGPSGASVGGWTIRLVNGANGQTYGSVSLPSGAELAGTGTAVLAMKNPNDYFENRAPSMTNVYKVLEPYQAGVDALQNGPDNIVLEDDTGSVVDAVGYGNFSSSSTQFVGEGNPAPPVPSGRSLGRRDEKDTDDNAADFVSFYPTPGLKNSDLVINEIYPNQPGRDDGSKTFVEIAAPIPGWENLPLDGYRLHAINGHDGQDYLPASGGGIPLFGHELHDGPPDDGYFVVCNEAAPEAPELPWCSLRYEGADWQNGPDNVVLRYEGRVVDAVGYGSFGPDDHFVGEGMPMSDYTSTDAGKSIGRWPLPNVYFDSDQNYLDFWKMTPSAGVKNEKP